MEKLTELDLRGFADVLASKAPVPGGGGAAALTGALAASLCAMVGNLTVGRKKYAAVEEDVRRLTAQAEALERKLVGLVDADAEAFEPLQKAYAIPKDDPHRAEILEKVSLDACSAPMEMMKCCAEAIVLLEEMYEKGSVMLVSDAGCGALLAGAAMRCASMNIFINTKPLSSERALALEKEADALMEEYLPRAEKTAAAVMGRIRKERL